MHLAKYLESSGVIEVRPGWVDGGSCERKGGMGGGKILHKLFRQQVRSMACKGAGSPSTNIINNEYINKLVNIVWGLPFHSL